MHKGLESTEKSLGIRTSTPKKPEAVGAAVLEAIAEQASSRVKTEVRKKIDGKLRA